VDHEKDDKCDNQEIDHDVDEDPILDERRSCLLCIGEAGVGCRRQVDVEVAKVDLTKEQAMGGMRISLTKEDTILPKAPMMTATARSSTLPRMTNALNSLSIETPPFVEQHSTTHEPNLIFGDHGC
jgi:hypothetical protein